MRPTRCRLHFKSTSGSLEGLVLRRPWRLGGYYKIVDAAFLESRTDRHDLDNIATFIPREDVRICEVLKP